MKKAIAFLLSMLLLSSLLVGCSTNGNPSGETSNPPASETKGSENTDTAEKPAAPSVDLGGDNTSFGEALDGLGAYDGYFEEIVSEVVVTCVSGTDNCYSLNNGILTFTSVKEDSVYSVSGKLRGCIVIDVGDAYKFDLELQGFSLVSSDANPIFVASGDEVSITAKSEFENYIYDIREAIDDTDETLYSGAIHSMVDLEICGKGSLTLVSENNNGIHSKDDLQVKNLTLLVACTDNALKGNDSVEITNGNTTLIAAQGDGIKTTNSDISEKGNQRGTVSISGGIHSIYAACDGIDAAYNVIVDGETTELNIYTDKYSNYSSEVTAVDENLYYIRFTSNSYKYSVKYYNSDDDYFWVNAEYHSTASGGRYNYYYYSFPKISEYSKMQFFMYSSDMEQSQDEEYLVGSDYLTPNAGYDTFALTSQGNSLMYQWTNYTTSVQESGFGGGMGGHGGMGGRGGMGGMNDGNTDKGDYSTKGIKAGNEITINAGSISIKSYDDAIHANNDTSLENGETPTGNVTVNGGAVTVYSNDDGLHADGTLTIADGTVSVLNSYEGLEGTRVIISGGNVTVVSSDDGINGTATSDTSIEISGGTIYVNCTGDGIDSNSRTSYKGIVFSGGNTVVISNSQNNSAIDTEQGYSYTGGSVVAIMPSRGMTSEATHCSNFSSIGKSSDVSLNAGAYLTIAESNSAICIIQMPVSISARVIYLGSKSVSISSASSSDVSLNDNGVCWSK